MLLRFKVRVTKTNEITLLRSDLEYDHLLVLPQTQTSDMVTHV